MLANFLDEAAEIEKDLAGTKGDADEHVESDTVPSKAASNDDAGKVFMSGCHDWENMTNKNCVGLPDLHEVELPELAVQTFSSSNSQHLHILLVNGSLMALGRNNHGQLGVGNDSRVYHQPIPVTLPLKISVAKISTGKSHSLLLSTDGAVYATGSNEFGQLGLGEGKKYSDGVSSFTPIPQLTSNVKDIACGHDYSVACSENEGYVYTFGHPEYGQLGHGTNGEYIEKSGKTSYHYVMKPQIIENYYRKDKHSKILNTISYTDVKIRSVTAGKNHTMLIEEWDTSVAPKALNRVFAFGTGGYGRLGHGSAITADELAPREVAYFTCQLQDGSYVMPINPQLKLRHIFAGPTFSLGVSETGLLYHWGKMASARGGESTMYPKMEPATQTLPCGSRVAAGHNCVVLGFNDCSCVWGAPCAGYYGLEGGARSTTVPKYVEGINDLCVTNCSAGYGHVAYVVKDRGDNAEATRRFANFPKLQPASTLSQDTAGEKKRNIFQKKDGGSKKARK